MEHAYNPSTQGLKQVHSEFMSSGPAKAIHCPCKVNLEDLFSKTQNWRFLQSHWAMKRKSHLTGGLVPLLFLSMSRQYLLLQSIHSNKAPNSLGRRHQTLARHRTYHSLDLGLPAWKTEFLENFIVSMYKLLSLQYFCYSTINTLDSIIHAHAHTRTWDFKAIEKC